MMCENLPAVPPEDADLIRNSLVRLAKEGNVEAAKAVREGDELDRFATLIENMDDDELAIDNTLAD